MTQPPVVLATRGRLPLCQELHKLGPAESSLLVRTSGRSLPHLLADCCSRIAERERVPLV